MRKLINLILTLGLILAPGLVWAADMYFILDKTQVAENGTFSGTVYLSTGGVAINSAEGTIHFPTDLVSVDSVSNTGSIFNIWVEHPTFSNTSGTVNFNGGLPTPGYSGQAGNSLRINFRAKKAGVAKLSFGSSAIRADDGNGTNVLSQTRDSSVTITGVTPVVVPPPVVVPTTPVPPPVVSQGAVPGAPVITSDDMPDQNGWYNNTEGTFSWELSSGVTAVQLVLAKSASTLPTVTYDPPIKKKILTGLTEGTFYLNARLKNEAGWGKITSRKIKIDTTAPENITVKTEKTEEDLISLEAWAKDTLSGVKSYVVYNNEDKLIEVPATANGPTKFNLPPLAAGSYKLELRVYDRAGNYDSTDVLVDSPEVQAPKITHYPEAVKVGSSVEIRGKSPYADGEIVLWFQAEDQEAKSYLVRPDEDKIFFYSSDSIETVGILNVWAETVRGSGAKSLPTGKVYITVKQSEVMSLGTRAIQIISIAITFLVLLFLLLLMIYLGIKKLNSLKRKLRRDLVHTEQEVHKVFQILKGDTKRHLKMLERASTKRKLTKEESKIMAEMTENLDEAEKYLAEKIKVIENPD